MTIHHRGEITTARNTVCQKQNAYHCMIGYVFGCGVKYKANKHNAEDINKSVIFQGFIMTSHLINKNNTMGTIS